MFFLFSRSSTVLQLLHGDAESEVEGRPSWPISRLSLSLVLKNRRGAAAPEGSPDRASRRSIFFGTLPNKEQKSNEAATLTLEKIGHLVNMLCT